MEVVIILRNIGEDAQSVWYSQSNHILCIQQGWDPQLLLCHSKCLEKEGKKEKVSCPAQATELLLITSKKLHCKQPHSNNNSTGEQMHQFNSYIARPLQEPTESWLPATTLRNSGREPKIWPGKLAVAHCTGTHLGFPCSSSVCLYQDMHSCRERGLAEGDVSVQAGRLASRLPAQPGVLPN